MRSVNIIQRLGNKMAELYHINKNRRIDAFLSILHPKNIKSGQQ